MTKQGTIHLKDDSCKPRWAQWTKGNDCGALNLPCHISNMFVPQNKYYKAKLENYSTDDDPLVACMNTPVTSDVPISNKYLSQKVLTFLNWNDDLKSNIETFLFWIVLNKWPLFFLVITEMLFFG